MHRQMIYAMVTAGEKVKIVKMRVLVLALLATFPRGEYGRQQAYTGGSESSVGRAWYPSEGSGEPWGLGALGALGP